MSVMLRPVRYLQAVVQHANFTRAAESLHVSQPALSQQIRLLEESLGVQLLDRSGRAVRLTDAGAAYLDFATRALRDLEAGERAVLDVADLSRGRVRLATTPTLTPYLVGPLFDAFQQRHPAITLNHVEMTQDGLEAALAEDAVDLAIAFTPRRADEVESEEVMRESLRVVVGAGHALALPAAGGGAAAPLSLQALAQQPWALLTASFITRGHIDRYFADQGLTPLIGVEVNTVAALTAIVQQGHALTILPAAVALANPALRALELDPPPPDRPVLLMRRRGAYSSIAARAFVDLVRDLAPRLRA